MSEAAPTSFGEPFVTSMAVPVLSGLFLAICRDRPRGVFWPMPCSPGKALRRVSACLRVIQDSTREITAERARFVANAVRQKCPGYFRIEKRQTEPTAQRTIRSIAVGPARERSFLPGRGQERRHVQE